MSIQRWDDFGDYASEGDYVLYSDHVAAVKAAEQRIEESVDRAWEATLRSKPTVVRYYADEIGVTATIRQQAIDDCIAAVEAACIAAKHHDTWDRIPHFDNTDYLPSGRVCNRCLEAIAALRALKEQP